MLVTRFPVGLQVSSRVVCIRTASIWFAGACLFVIGSALTQSSSAQTSGVAENLGTDGSTIDESVYQFTDADRQFLRRFSLRTLTPLPAALSNRVADDSSAAAWGHQLFFDKQLSVNGEVSCASCHQPGKYFTDGQKVSIGLGRTQRNAPSVPGAIRSQWLYWDGRKDSLWSQALAPLEHPMEHGSSRLDIAQSVIELHHDAYRAIFGPIENPSRLLKLTAPASPIGDERSQRNWERINETQQAQINRIFSNVGKALMAYERRLELGPARFDDFLELLQEQASVAQLKAIMSVDEVQGMRLFMGQGNCASCHNGPLLSNAEFHNIGAPEPNPGAVDLGRHGAIPQLVADEFTCLSLWSDARGDCDEMRFLKQQGPELVGAFRTPSLRNVAETAPYMQSGQFATLAEVLAHYNVPTPPFYDREQHPSRPHFDILPLRLEESQLQQLAAFLATLTSPIPDNRWWRTPSIEPR